MTLKSCDLICRSRFVGPKNGIDAEFVHFVNEDYQVMTQNLAQRFIDHRHIGLAAQGVAELPLHHRKGRFDIRPLVIVGKEILPVEHEVVVHVPPHTPAVSLVMVSKRDVGSRAQNRNGVRVHAAGVSLVSGDFGDSEVLSRRVQQWGQHRGVSRMAFVNLDCGDDIGFDSAHEMALDPIVLLPNLSVLMVKPASESGRSKPAGIYRKIDFHRFQRQAAFRYEVAENRRQIGVLQIVENRVVVRCFGDESAHLGIAQIGHKSPSANGRIDLEYGAENGVRNRESGATELLRLRFRNATAQVTQQGLELVFFVRLRGIVRRPSLRVGGAFRHGDGLGHRRTAIGILLALHYKGSRINVLARAATVFKVGTLARRKLLGELHPVHSAIALRRHEPPAIPLANSSRCRQFHSALLSQVHSVLAYLRDILLIRYILVKDIITKISLDSIFLSGISSVLWGWSRLIKRAINVIAAPTSGCPVSPLRESRAYAPSARVRTGISHAGTRKRHDNLGSLAVLAEREGFEPPTVCVHSAAVLQTAPLTGLRHLSVNRSGEECPLEKVAPRPTSYASSKRNIVVRDFSISSLIPPVRSSATIPSMALNFALIVQALQSCVNDGERILILAQWKAAFLQGVSNCNRRDVRAPIVLHLSHDISNRFGNSNRLRLVLFAQQFAETKNRFPEDFESRSDVLQALLSACLLGEQFFHFSFSGIKGVFVMPISHSVITPGRLEFT
jgi:hypothetical protein